MHPAVFIVGVQTHGIVHAQHHGKVAQLHAHGVAHQYAKAPDTGILANTLHGNVHVGGVVLALYLQALGTAAKAVHIAVFDGAHDTYGHRTCLQSLLVGIDNGLQSCIGTGSALAAVYHIQGHRFGGGCGDVDNAGIALQTSVVVVGSHCGA